MSGDPAAAETGAAQSVPDPVRVLVPSRIGPLGVEFRHTAISRLVVAPTASLRRLFHPFGDFEDSEFLDEVFGRLSEYLAGARRTLDLEFDLGAATLEPFARRVLRETTRVPYGRTRTYKEIAEAAGQPEAYRQTMAILEKNPLPLLIPCHRVVPSKSGIGGWVGGAAKKRWLLKMEQEAAPQLL